MSAEATRLVWLLSPLTPQPGSHASRLGTRIQVQVLAGRARPSCLGAFELSSRSPADHISRLLLLLLFAQIYVSIWLQRERRGLVGRVPQPAVFIIHLSARWRSATRARARDSQHVHVVVPSCRKQKEKQFF